MGDKSINSAKGKILAISLIILGSIAWSLTTVKSGIKYDYGIGFWGPHGHDGVWHISLAESLAKGSFQMPTYAGIDLKNYHIGYDLFLAFLHNLTGIGVSTLYFQILPPIMAVLIGFLFYRLTAKLFDQKVAIVGLTFLYFGTSFGPLVTLIREGVLSGESMFWSQQSTSTLLNPPYAASLLMILLGMNVMFVGGLKKVRDYVIVILSFGVLLQVKAYAGALVISGLFVLASYKLLQSKRNYLAVFLFTLILNILVFLPTNSSSGSLLGIDLFWFPLTMLAVSDRFDWPRLYEAISNWRLAGAWHKSTVGLAVASTIFIVGNLGIRSLSFVLPLLQGRKIKITDFDIFVLPMILVGLFAPLVFVQEGTPWNIIQFMYYALFFLNIYAAATIVKISRFFGQKIGVIVVVAISLSQFLPSSISLAQNYLPERPPAKLPSEELEALLFLSKQEDGIVLSFPFDKFKAKEEESDPPRPLAYYESTAYVSAFSKKQSFFENEVNLTITGVNWKERRQQVLDFHNTLDINQAREFLTRNNIKYIYWIDGQRAKLGETQLGISLIFENKQVKMYVVDSLK